MNLLPPAEIVTAYSHLGPVKTGREGWKQLVLGCLAGVIIAMGGLVSAMAACTVENPSLARLISGLLFPFGLGIVMLLGAELFTGNMLLVMPLAERKVSAIMVLRNWALVYLANFAGALLVVGCAVYFGGIDFSGGALAVALIRTAAFKSALPFGRALVLGVFCNLLVCMGVLCSMTAKDTTGRILGAYLPTSFFVIAGFEHCVANMFIIPAGLLAAQMPQYAQLAAEAGIETTSLTFGNFIGNNLVPVTLGNMLGGVVLGLMFWAGHKAKSTGR